MKEAPPGIAPGGACSFVLGIRVRSHQIEIFLLGDRAELFHRPSVELADALLGDAELLADLLQRHALGVSVQTRSHANDFAFARQCADQNDMENRSFRYALF